MASRVSHPTIIDVIECKATQDKPKTNSVFAWFSAHWKELLAEFVATTILVLFNCTSSIPINGLTEQSPLYNPIAVGLTVMLNVQIFGHVSGAYMNPAVTLAAVMSGTLSLALGISYFFIQVLGATVGYGILVGIAPIDVFENGVCVLLPHPGLNPIQALGIEIILTGTLAFVCCGVWDPVNQHLQDSAPIKYGLTIIALSLVGGPLTGASTNPARSIGPAIWNNSWTLHWIYWVGPFMGASLAATFYRLICLKKDKESY